MTLISSWSSDSFIKSIVRSAITLSFWK